MRRLVVATGALAAALTAAATLVWIDVLDDHRARAATAPVAAVQYAPPTVDVAPGADVDQAKVTAYIEQITNDPRGWRTDLGHITLRIVRPGDYGTQPMPGRIGRAWPGDNLVVVTSEAWTTLGPKFAKVGGTLDDQRTWIVLHEIGHLVAEDGRHKECPGSGPAPLMRATNYEIGDCDLNVWPNPVT